MSTEYRVCSIQLSSSIPEALFLPWGRRRRAPPRCHSHHPHPPDEGLGAALPQTRVRARYCCWDGDLYRTSLTRSRKPLNWQAQTQRNTTCFVPRQSNAIIADLGCYRAFAERNMFSSCFAPSPSSFFQRNREHAVLAAEKWSGRSSHLPKRAISTPLVFAEGAGATAVPHAQPRPALEPGARATYVASLAALRSRSLER